MTNNQAAQYLGLSPATLKKWRLQRKPPKYFRFSRSIRYHRSDLDQFRDARGVDPEASDEQ